jgi:Asp/Glu/hydantoin racemase
MTTPRIALIHAVQVAMRPVEDAFGRVWPQAQWFNLLDDALPADLEKAGAVNERLTERIEGLAAQARLAGADGILYTCSAFGSAIEKVAQSFPVPVLKPNEAMFRAALSSGKRVGMLATFAPAVSSMEREFQEMARCSGVEVELVTLCVPEAIQAAREGNIERHNQLLALRAPELAGCDAVMLAHFSTTPAMASVKAVLSCPVFSAPDAAVSSLKQLLG